MSLVRVKTKAQITLPLGIRQALGIEEGDYLQVAVQGNKVVLTPQALLAKLPPVTLSSEGEAMLQEALADVREGRVRAHNSVDDLIDDLHDEAH
jgi:AbrB family looped-hinge helix DNA binding protein